MSRKFLHTPIVPVPVSENMKLRDLLLNMHAASFQGRQLGKAFIVWETMLKQKCFVFMGLAGAMIPAGMRGVIDWLIKERKIHCLVSTGANLFHEIHEALGRHHYRGHPAMGDVMLREAHVDRIYDTLADDEEFLKLDRFIHDFAANNFNKGELVTTAEFFKRLGKRLKSLGKKSFLVSAYERGVPVYCSAIGDSSYGIALAAYNDDNLVLFDVIEDVRELGRLVLEHPKTGVIYLGGGTPKNFIQQSEIVAMEIARRQAAQKKGKKADQPELGHSYAIQISTDAPHWGGLSGCPLEEGQSWGKESPEAEMVNLYCDVTIALPILANALAQKKS